MMVTSSLELAQTPFVIIHRKVLFPTDKPVMLVVGLVGSAKTPDPDTSVQNPLPTPGVLADKVVVVLQMV